MAENRIGPYSIVRLIKQGGEGKVYLGYDRRLQRKVAIKIDALPQGRGARRRALAEARKVARINSPHVAQIYDLVESGGYLAIVMEYVPGVDLEELLARRRLSLASVLAVAADLSAALAASRQCHIVHGDLKAANVLIAASGGVKLTDFGIARYARDTAAAEAGSLSALSPEHFTGAPLDIRSDLFALGALLYRMLSGEHPFLRDGKLDSASFLTIEQLTSRLQRPDQELVPGELVVLVATLLQPDPADRPQNTHPVRSQLRTLQRSLPLHAVHTLQREAEPFYRPEAATDIPPDIPGQLRAKGRSRMQGSFAARALRRFSSLLLSTRLALASIFMVAMGLLVAVAVEEQAPVRVHFEPPQVVFSSREGVPPGINSEWLMHHVHQALEASLGPMHVSGSVQPRAYYAALADQEPAYVINTGLRCSDVLCVFSISRRDEVAFDYRQTMISPDLPTEVWSTLVEESSRALFP